ncbi:hypothetical protein BD779DRAFT_770278 [Infundibulicybe gibba]|nr:hypothetical protein BD779DRAFT_770278 [Infundibulicybe gibba]
MEIESDGPTFASPSPERIPRISKRRRETQDHDLTPNAMASSGYRIIKRAESYAAQCQSSNDSFARKKQKICELSTPPHTHSFRSASLRRAESLRSTDDNMIPTEPATPTNYIHPCRPLQPPVPIIAPPDQHVSTFPLNPEAAAKLRLQRLVEREAAGRERDGLYIKPQAPRLAMESGDWEEVLTIHELPEEAIGHNADNFDQDKWDDILGIGGALRSRVVEWILKVLPVYPHFTRPQIRSPAPLASPASFSTSTSMTSSRSASLISTSTNQTIEYTSPLGVPDLLDQLATSPETRFHAAYMFLRYFFLVMGDSPQSPISRRHAITGTLAESGEADDVWELVIWDIAIGCMSLSVKFHRDCLEPLVPVLSHEFQALAPHRPSHQDLENAQRDVLEAFSYQLGMTPQAFMDDLWLALSSLRLLLNFSGAWSNVRQQAWGILFDSVLEPDILQFPVSLLAAAAIIEGTITTLVLKYETEARWCGEVAQRGRYRTKPKDIPMYIVDRKSELRNKRIRRAEREAEGVIQDIQAALTIKDADMKWCRAWLLL